MDGPRWRPELPGANDKSAAPAAGQDGEHNGFAPDAPARTFEEADARVPCGIPGRPVTSGTALRAPGAIRVEWRRAVREVLPLGPIWDRTLSGWGIDNTFLRWDWIRTWLRIYAGQAPPLVGVLRSGERIVGLVPLCVQRHRVTRLGPALRSIRLIGDGPLCPDHLVLPFAPGEEEACARALVEALSAEEWDRIELRDLLEAHPAWKSIPPAARALAPAEAARLTVRERTHCPYITLPASWDAYVRGLSQNARRALNQGLRRFEDELHATVFRPATVDEVDLLMARLEDLHAQNWNARGRPGVFADARFRLFHRVHARRLFRSERLLLLSLRTERDVAVFLGFLTGRTAQYYQLGHDPGLKRYGLGNLAIAEAIRASIGSGRSEMDLLRGTGEHKSRITRNERRGTDVILGRNTAADRAARTAEDARRTVGGTFRAVLNRKQIERVKRMLHLPD